MNNIIVTQAEKGKFKVLCNFIQYGIAYNNQAQAEKEAQTLKNKLEGKTK